MVELKAHQLEASDFLWERRRAIVADDLGLGKTYTALRAAVIPCLVVAPKHLHAMWEEAIKQYHPHWSVGIAKGHALERQQVIAAKPDVTIVNYEMISRMEQYPELFRRAWPLVIWDEAHRLRSRNAKWTKNACKIPAHRVYMLTGTPIVNNPGDLYPLLHIIDQREFTSYWKFVELWCQMESTPWQDRPLRVKPGIEKRFYQMLSRYMMRRLQKQVGLELPPLSVERLPVELSQSTKVALKRARDELRVLVRGEEIPLMGAGAKLAVMRRLCEEDPDKIQATVDLTLAHEGQSAIVWTWFRNTTYLLETAFRKATNRPVYRLDGGMTDKARTENMEKFRSTGGILIATIASTSEGANLQKASVVVFHGFSYLATENDQATARAYRMGQTRAVNVYYVTGKNSLDTRVLTVARRRRTNTAQALQELIRMEIEGNVELEPRDGKAQV